MVPPLKFKNTYKYISVDKFMLNHVKKLFLFTVQLESNGQKTFPKLEQFQIKLKISVFQYSRYVLKLETKCVEKQKAHIVCSRKIIVYDMLNCSRAAKFHAISDIRNQDKPILTTNDVIESSILTNITCVICKKNQSFHLV